MFNKEKELEKTIEILRDRLEDLYDIVNLLLGEAKLEAHKRREHWEVIKTK